MTLIFQSMTSSVNGSTSGGKASESGKTSSGDAFGQALVQQMSSTGTIAASAKDTAALMLNASVQMLKELPVLSEGSSTADAQMPVALDDKLQQDNALDLGLILMSLLQDLKKLEEALDKDPSLLKELQVWLMQAAAMLNGVQEQSEATDQQQQQQTDREGQILSPLASHPETIRFAVQDALTQLSNMLKNTSLSEQAKPQLLELVQSFQTMLAENGDGKGKGTVDNKSHAASALIGQSEGEIAAAVDKKELPVSIKPVLETAKVVEAAAKTTALSEEKALTEESAAGNKLSMTESDANTITAGQLALRSGTTAPVKPAAQPVPAEHFAKEMTNLVVNKLEFVKQQGFTEARISLYPEHLGQVDIKITMQNGQLVAQFMTQNSDARELLDQQMSQLRSALQGQGLQVEKLEVTQNSQSSSSQFYQDGRQPGSGQQESNRRSREKDVPSDDAVAAAAITEEWNEWLAERQTDEEQGHSGTFTAKV